MKTNIVNITTETNDIPIFLSPKSTMSVNLWFSGCDIGCKGCHNTALQIPREGLELEYVYSMLEKRKELFDWVVFIGGDPLYESNRNMCEKIAMKCKELGYKIFLYTGHMTSMASELISLDLVDYIKCGCYDKKYDKKMYDKNYIYATINQKIIDSNGERVYYYDTYKNETIINVE